MNYLKISFIAFFAMVMCSCQKDNGTKEEQSVIPSKSSANPEYYFIVFDNVELTKDIYTLVDADSMIWSVKGFENGIFQYDFDYVWETVDTDLVSVDNNNLSNEWTLTYSDGTIATITSITTNGNITTLNVMSNDGHVRAFEINMPENLEIINALSCYAQGTSTGIIPRDWLRKIAKLFKRYCECQYHLQEHAAICKQHYGCRAHIYDSFVSCDPWPIIGSQGCNCSQYDYQCNS